MEPGDVRLTKRLYAQVNLVDGLHFQDAKPIALEKIRAKNPGHWPRMENAKFSYQEHGDFDYLWCVYEWDPEESS